MAAIYSMENEVFAALVFYGALVLAKMVAVSLLVTVRRVTLDVYSNPEDCNAYNPKVKPTFNNDAVERARRNHANDVENITLFMMTALLYCAVSPSVGCAIWHFRVFVATRFLHTFAYQVLQVAQIRTLSHVAGVFANISMLVQIFTALF